MKRSHQKQLLTEWWRIWRNSKDSCNSRKCIHQLYLVCRIDKRSKYSRRRGMNPEADVDYINDRNMRFNKKAARYYDKFTAEIKQNLERGTAV